MRIRTPLKAGRINAGRESLNHRETVQVPPASKAGEASDQQDERRRVRSAPKPGRLALRVSIRTSARKGDRLELLVVRAGLKGEGTRAAGSAARRARSRS